MELKDQLTDLVKLARDYELALIESLTQEERAAKGTAKHWSIKDDVAHLAYWKKRAALTYAAASKGEVPPEPVDYNLVNDQIFDEFKDESWDEVMAFSKNAHEEFASKALALSVDDLTETDRFSWQEGRPLWRNVAGQGFIHPVQHLANIYIARGQIDTAIELEERGAKMVLELDDSPTWQGITIYNLACVYALVGYKDQAIANLAKALKLNPDLTEWSKEDPDFASIRDEAAYIGLYSK